ncbi:MAG: 3-methyl-2-oxobutanoate hydroxymethyltransferase, partial [Steroidobacteraceae bacterium]
MKSVLDFAAAKAAGRKISMVTCYDASLARVLEASQVDCLLVGDSAAMVMHGQPDTLAATVDLMAMHTAAVRRGAPTRFLIADLPFLSFRKGVPAALDAVAAMMRAGAQAVKLEGVAGHEDVVAAITGSGVPVMGHLGLTPQSVNALAGYRVQGRTEDSAMRIIEEAKQLEALGCFSLVLECVPSALAARITGALAIPTIGIGAGIECDGQVLVLQDLLGLSNGHRPKFLRTYLDGFGQVRDAVDRFDRDVKQGAFPTAAES